jgi:hypothetical protein
MLHARTTKPLPSSGRGFSHASPHTTLSPLRAAHGGLQRHPAPFQLSGAPTEWRGRNGRDAYSGMRPLDRVAYSDMRPPVAHPGNAGGYGFQSGGMNRCA